MNVQNVGEAEPVVPPRAELGEGPRWDDASRTLLWVDILGRAVHRFDPATGRDTKVSMPATVSLAVPRAAGGTVIAMPGGLAVFEEPHLTKLAPIEAGMRGNRPNDGACDPAGRLWVGTMSLDERSPTGGLYRVDADLSVTRLLSGTIISNGLGWSPEHDRFYFIDTPLRRIDVFDYDEATGSIERRRPLAEVAGPGSPDGMSVDAEGCLWVAMHGGWALRRYSPGGELLAEVRLPVAKVTSCCFGGPDLQDLYVTTRRESLSERELQEQPWAGALLRLDMGVKGTATYAFAG